MGILQRKVSFQINSLVIILTASFSLHEKAALCAPSLQESPEQKQMDTILRDPITPPGKSTTLRKQEATIEHNPTAVDAKALTLSASRGISPAKWLTSLKVKVQNHTDSAFIVDGDKAIIASAGSANPITTCVSQEKLDDVGRPPTTAAQKIKSDVRATVVAAVTVGGYQAAEGYKMSKAPFLKRYEWDEQRRENEESRFGKRLIYPGDSSEGNIYFYADTQFNGTNLVIPVKSYYDGSPQAPLNISLENIASQPKETEARRRD